MSSAEGAALPVELQPLSESQSQHMNLQSFIDMQYKR
jgi:hypothetical protein